MFWFGSLISFMDPIGIRVRVLGVPVFTIWGLDGQLVYFAVRGSLFAVAAVLILSASLMKSSNETTVA